MEQFAKVFGGDLGHLIDAQGYRHNILGDPCSRCAPRGTNARPNALVVLVKTNAPRPAVRASSRRLRVPVTFVATKSCREGVRHAACARRGV